MRISIHAPRVGSDVAITPMRELPIIFQSTLPVWGATAFEAVALSDAAISIHAPRVGSDDGLRRRSGDIGHFNPRSPCGERHGADADKIIDAEISIHAPRVGSDDERRICVVIGQRFQSTLPVWGATEGFEVAKTVFGISIHAPRVGSDSSFCVGFVGSGYFNPRSPCGERPGPC